MHKISRLQITLKTHVSLLLDLFRFHEIHNGTVFILHVGCNGNQLTAQCSVFGRHWTLSRPASWLIHWHHVWYQLHSKHSINSISFSANVLTTYRNVRLQPQLLPNVTQLTGRDKLLTSVSCNSPRHCVINGATPLALGNHWWMKEI